MSGRDKTLIHFAAMLLTGVFLQAQNSIEVTMTHFNNNDGKARVGLYNEAGQFLNKTFKALDTDIADKTATVVFQEIPDGTYAISCYHDEDNNGQLNMFLGMMPKEDYGCSNGAQGFFGPPKWEDARFEVKNGEVKQIEIKL